MIIALCTSSPPLFPSVVIHRRVRHPMTNPSYDPPSNQVLICCWITLFIAIGMYVTPPNVSPNVACILTHRPPARPPSSVRQESTKHVWESIKHVWESTKHVWEILHSSSS